MAILCTLMTLIEWVGFTVFATVYRIIAISSKASHSAELLLQVQSRLDKNYKRQGEPLVFVINDFSLM